MPHKEIDILATIGPHSDDKETIVPYQSRRNIFPPEFLTARRTHRKTADLIRKIDAKEKHAHPYSGRSARAENPYRHI